MAQNGKVIRPDLRRGTIRVPALAYLDEKYGLENLGPGLYSLAKLIRTEGGNVAPHRLDALVNELGGPWSPTPRLRSEYDRKGEPVVYYLRFDRLCKIGTSRDLTSRIAQIPHDELLATEPGGVEVERFRHAQFRTLRHRLEWFRYEGALVEHVQRLKEQAA